MKPPGRFGSGRRWIARLTLAGVSFAFALLACELVLRCTYTRKPLVPGFQWQIELQNAAFVRDPELGYRPRLGTRWYDAYGTRPDPDHLSLDKAPGKKRILFMGDSVTWRRAIENACRKQFGVDAFDYWNAGVESYDTRQEVIFYKRYNHKIDPDHVILSFHHNDFIVTPVAFHDDDEQMTVVFSDGSSHGVNPWLLRYSYTYALWSQWRVAEAAERDMDAGEAIVRESLRELQRILAGQGARLTVLVLPLATPHEEWNARDKATHQRALRVLEDLGIRHFDLLPGLNAAAQAGIEIQETKGDRWHPSQALGEAFVKQLAQSGFTL